jgi:tRNA(Ile)-lysidine synthase
MYPQFILNHIRPQFQLLVPGTVVWVAYSGGLDSRVLLQSMVALRDSGQQLEIKAVHVHHGLHEDADQWTEHCQEICSNLGVSLEVLRVDAKAATGESPEAAARTARYQAISSLLQDGEYLVTAHHQDDQAETFLLQLMRGSGVYGLSAMPVITRFSRGFHLRPFLGLKRAALRQYAEEAVLDWIEDSSNESLDFDRNFLRHEITPVLNQRWHAASGSISRSARHLGEAAELLDQLAREDLDNIAVAGNPAALNIPALRLLYESRQRNLLRYWIRSLGLPLPSTRVLQHLMEDVLNARTDATPCVNWGDIEARRYRDQLFLIRQPDYPDPAVFNQAWDMKCRLEIPGIGTLSPHTVTGRGIKLPLPEGQDLTIRLRQGGERIRPEGRGHEHTLKKLMQERGIPPWERERMPILYIDGKIAAVPGICVCEGFQAGKNEPGCEILLQPVRLSIEH